MLVLAYGGAIAVCFQKQAVGLTHELRETD